MHKLTSLLLFSCLLGPALDAQTYVWSPANTAKNVGGSNNTIPFWSQSATYQQIHDAGDFGPVTQMKGLAMRNWRTRTTAGRTWEMRITLSTTKVTAATATGTFATNLGTTNVKTVVGTATTFTKFSWKSSTTSGNGPHPPAFTIPFGSAYTYVRATGNLCWEWRHKNATSNATMAMDATSGGSQRGTIGAKTGTGCTVKGNTSPADATVTTPFVSSAYQYRVTLTNGAASQNALLAIGVVQKQTKVPGWCANIELTPAAILAGKTSSTGTWQFETPLSGLVGTTPFNVLTQFAFNDPGHSSGLGLSNMTSYMTPTVPGAHAVARVWKAAFGGTTNGDELATSGSLGKNFGLICGWLQ